MDIQKKVHIKRRGKRRRVCCYCANKVNRLDYKATSLFKKFITDRCKIVPKRNSGICAKHQRMLAQTIKRARFMGLVPYTID